MKKAIVGVLGTIFGVGIGYVGSKCLCNKGLDARQGKMDKFKGYYIMLNQWLFLKQEGKSLEKYFIDNGYRTIAIYGMGELGSRLYEELKDSDAVEIKYAIDQNAADIDKKIEVREIEEPLGDVDAIVVTATFAFEDIRQKIRGLVKGDIVSLDDVVFGLQ